MRKKREFENNTTYCNDYGLTAKREFYLSK